LIVCGVYAAQNLAGNLIANQSVFFFERESSSGLCHRTECVYRSD
jgi:SP family general alpha glucoside:H+ symporter-like MFS transporter